LFSNVEEFLRRARLSKTNQRPEVEQFVSEHFEDPRLIVVPPDFAGIVEEYVERYGDEALRQIALFCMGKWFAIHTAYAEELVKHDNPISTVVATTVDATHISQAINMLEDVGSFSGTDEWHAMVKELAIGVVNDELNKQEHNDA
jgi:hypothetical protein